jgi:hypothetical protein
MLTTQAPVPLQAPLQPEKVLSASGVAVKFTLVPLLKLALHVAPQLMPAGVLVTVPLPVLVTLSPTKGCICVTEADAAEGALVPTALVASTLKV